MMMCYKRLRRFSKHIKIKKNTKVPVNTFTDAVQGVSALPLVNNVLSDPELQRCILLAPAPPVYTFLLYYLKMLHIY